MPSKTDIQLSHLAGEIEATQLVLVAYLAGIAEASLGGHQHIEAVFRLAGKLAETTAELTGGGAGFEDGLDKGDARDSAPCEGGRVNAGLEALHTVAVRGRGRWSAGRPLSR